MKKKIYLTTAISYKIKLKEILIIKIIVPYYNF